MLPYNKPGRFQRGGPLVSGHTASVLDFDFNPFHEQVRVLSYHRATVVPACFGVPGTRQSWGGGLCRWRFHRGGNRGSGREGGSVRVLLAIVITHAVLVLTIGVVVPTMSGRRERYAGFIAGPAGCFRYDENDASGRLFSSLFACGTVPEAIFCNGLVRHPQ